MTDVGSAARAATTAARSMSTGAALGLAAGAAALGGVLGYAGARDDGSRRVTRRRASDYTLRPQSQEAARGSISSQRAWAIGQAVLGLGVVGYGVLGRHSAGPMAVVAGGALVLGMASGRLVKLQGAEDRIDPTLPDRTPAGASDMVRTNDTSYRAFGLTAAPSYEGRGYDVHGYPTGSAFDSLSDPVLPPAAFGGRSLLERLAAQQAAQTSSTSPT